MSTSSTPSGACGRPAGPLASGSRLGPYVVDSLIAVGSMGAVYRARDSRLNRPVALKVLAPAMTGDVAGLARFTQEARTNALLNHPNIVVVYDVGSEGGTPYVVSELLHGETLRARLRGGMLPVRLAVDYAREIAHGLVAAHELDVVHRDLKPENVFITTDGRVKILDFGLAKCRNETLGVPTTGSSDSTQPGTILGTVGYMAPEQVRGSAADARADIFSLGVILHEMLAGRPPFVRESAIETLYAILREDAPPLPYRDGLSPELAQIVRHCLEKMPAARFQSARDLAFILGFALRSPQPLALAPASAAHRLLASLVGLF